MRARTVKMRAGTDRVDGAEEVKGRREIAGVDDDSINGELILQITTQHSSPLYSNYNEG